MSKKEETRDQKLARIDEQSALLSREPELATFLRELAKDRAMRREFAMDLARMLAEDSPLIMRMIMLGEDAGHSTVAFAKDWHKVEQGAKKLRRDIEADVLESTSGTAKGSGVIRDVSDWADQPTYIGPPPVDPFEATLELAQLEEAGPSEATRRLRRAPPWTRRSTMTFPRKGSCSCRPGRRCTDDVPRFLDPASRGRDGVYSAGIQQTLRQPRGQEP